MALSESSTNLPPLSAGLGIYPRPMRRPWRMVCTRCGRVPHRVKPLDIPWCAIRILRLLPRFKYTPGKGFVRQSNEIACELQESRLDVSTNSFPVLSRGPDLPFYEALSYRWGNEKKSHCIRVDGTFCARVRPNLFAALETLRQKYDERLLWIDALCINQEDTQERGQQVALMYKIYAAAQRVIVWLGPLSSRAARDIDGLQHLDEGLDFPTLQPSDSLLKGNYWDYLASYLSELFHASWFTRLWILQEAMWAETILVCHGRLQFSWKFLVALVDFAERSTFTLLFENDACARAMRLVKDMRQWRQPNTRISLGLDEIVDSTTEYLCRDPRDHIFAVLALAPTASGSLLLQPDYDLSISFTQEKLALNCIYEYNSLSILLYIDHREDKDLEAPSWVPRWQSLASDTEGSSSQGNEQVAGKPVVRRPPDAPPCNGHCRDYLTSYLRVDPRLLPQFPNFWPSRWLEALAESRYLTLPARIIRPRLRHVSTGEVWDIIHWRNPSGVPQTSFLVAFLNRSFRDRRRGPGHVVMTEQTMDSALTIPKNIPASYFRGRRIAFFGRDWNAVSPYPSQDHDLWAIVPAISQELDTLVAFCDWKQGFVVRHGPPRLGKGMTERQRTQSYRLVGPCVVGGEMETKPDRQIHIV